MMIRIRMFEESLADLYRRGLLVGVVHLSVGQEATAVGVCSNSYVSGLSLADCVFSGRRAGRSAAL